MILKINMPSKEAFKKYNQIIVEFPMKMNEKKGKIDIWYEDRKGNKSEVATLNWSLK